MRRQRNPVGIIRKRRGKLMNKNLYIYIYVRPKSNPLSVHKTIRNIASAIKASLRVENRPNIQTIKQKSNLPKEFTTA